ncbi:MAG: hypothetical protein R3B06_21140 [Kofleriaceae bacterium]
MHTRVSSLVAAVAPLTLTGVALAHPPPPPDDEPAAPRRAVVEWSTWLRVAYGGQSDAAVAQARLVSVDRTGPSAWEAAGGADVTLPIGRRGDVRIGPWLELRNSGTFIGGELMLAAAPRKLDLFFYEGEGVLIARVGTDGERRTAALAYGYRAPWDLMHPTHGSSRYMIGVRVVATATQAIDDPAQWSATLGLETEPVGALRYLLGIRSWY